MNKLRFGFLAIVLIISIAIVMAFNASRGPLDKTTAAVSDFKITEIAGSGLYADKEPIQDGKIFSIPKVDIKQMHYPENLYITADGHTAFEFYYSGASFIAVPDSSLYYQPGTNTMQFLSGEFIWHKEITEKPVEISILFSQASAPHNITLSNEGKVSISPIGVQLWNYGGELKYSDGSETFGIQSNMYLTSIKNQTPLTAPLLEAPGFISPEEKAIAMDQPGDSTVKFSWKEVPGAQRYIFKLFSSKLMLNTLYEKQINANHLTLDLFQFDDFNTFYWQVYAYNPINEQEGTPSKMGILTISGAMFVNRETISKPPELNIKTFDVNGNLVIIEGNTDKNSQLFINNTPVTPNPDGTFIYTLHFTRIGKYKITFRVISPGGNERTLEKFATIYDE
ncbi:MAG: hypothetical protein MUF15_09710 [Acidobacteria bacterium]|jgi:hypothetical protein|nr:hypothetical protein [Acidobacteriota bacterium]